MATLSAHPASLEHTVTQLADALRARGWILATAESCTGGLMAAACTDLEGSSAWFDRGFVTYSNTAKTEMLGVPAALIAHHGAVSEAVVRAMAAGAASHAPVQAAVAVTGVAGPGGGSADKPVGTVWIGWWLRGQLHTERLQLSGDRQAVRRHTVHYALTQLLQRIQQDLAAPPERVGPCPMA